MLSRSVVSKSATSWTVAHQTPLFMGFFRQECRSQLTFPPPGDLPHPGVELWSPAFIGRFFTTEPSVQFSSVAQSCPTLCNCMECCTPGFPVHYQLLKLMSTESVMPSNHLVFCRPLLPRWIFPSIRVFSDESVLHIRWPKCWSFSFSISPSNEYSGLTSFKRDWLEVLTVQGTLKSLLQHHSSKGSILQHSAFFIVQRSLSYMTTGKP